MLGSFLYDMQKVGHKGWQTLSSIYTITVAHFLIQLRICNVGKPGLFYLHSTPYQECVTWMHHGFLCAFYRSDRYNFSVKWHDIEHSNENIIQHLLK